MKKLFLNDDERLDIRIWRKELLENPDVEYLESGGLKLEREEIDKTNLFSVYRLVGYWSEKKDGKR